MDVYVLRLLTIAQFENQVRQVIPCFLNFILKLRLRAPRQTLEFITWSEAFKPRFEDRL